MAMRSETDHQGTSRLLEAWDQLGDDEATVVLMIAERVAKARTSGGPNGTGYGELRISQDTRDHAHETLEEVSDALVYAAIRTVQVRDEKRIYLLEFRCVDPDSRESFDWQVCYLHDDLHRGTFSKVEKIASERRKIHRNFEYRVVPV